MKVIVIEPNKKPEVREIDSDYKTMKEIIGGYLEILPLGMGTEAVLDEEAKVRDDKIPVHNLFADEICESMLWRDGMSLIPGDYIVNTVVLIGSADEEGDWQSVPDTTIEFVEKAWKLLMED
jgi:Domain of unknown function (DUF3846)